MELRINSGESQGKTIEVTGDQFVIGRDSRCDLVIKDFKVSRRHAYLKVLPDGRAAIHDLGSSNGTYVNGQRVQSAILNGGEQLQFGDTLLVALVDAKVGEPAGGATEIAPAPGQGTELAPTPPPPAPPGPSDAPPTERLPTSQPGQAPPPPPPFSPTSSPTAGPGAPLPPFSAPAPPLGGGGAAPVVVDSSAQPGSTVQRLMLQRSVQRATIIGSVAIGLAVVVALLFGTGVLPIEEGQSSGGGGGGNVPAVVEEVTPSTLFIASSDGVGSGWVYNADEGLVVTNNHVIAGPTTQFSVRLGEETTDRVAELVQAAPCEDLALIKVGDTKGMRTLQLGSQSELKRGQTVIAVGFPASAVNDPNLSSNFTITSTVGTVAIPKSQAPGPGAGQDSAESFVDVVQTDAAINGGNSGGPLVNEQAELVGVNTFGVEMLQNTNYAIGVDRVKEIVPKLQQGEDVC